MDDLIWAAAVAACGWLAIWGRNPRRLPVHWVFKPLPVVLLLLAVLERTPPGHVRTLVAAGLVLSIAGDVVLMLPRRAFAAGLACFLLALVAYTVGFSVGVRFAPWDLLLFVVPAVPGGLCLRALWPHVGRLRPAVVAYVLAMVLLVWRLLARHDAGTASYVLGVTGGAAFLLADSLLALRRFAGRPVPYPLELAPYFIAQWCLAAATWT